MSAMDVLHDKIEEIRESGIGHGLSDRQIDSCILDALKQLSKSSKSTAGKRRRRSSCGPAVCRLLCWTGAGLVSFVCMLFVAVWINPDLQVQMKNQIEPWFYPITKNWRLLTLGLARRFDLSDFYSSQCLVNNPFVNLQSDDCEGCLAVRKEHSLITISTRQYENIYMGRAQPLVLKANHRNVTFDDLKSWYEGHGITFDAANRKLQKAPPGLHTIDQFLTNYTADDVISDPNFQLEWTSEAVNPSRLIRKLFPRPAFIPLPEEVSLLKTLIVTSAQAGAIEPGQRRRASPAQWYVQGSGAREIRLIPPNTCTDCKPITFILEQGDILCYNAFLWRLQSLPVEGQTNINVAFIGSLMLMM